MKPEFIKQLWNFLWLEYIKKVSYAQTYQQMITDKGGTVKNDHIAFRSLRMNVDTNRGKINFGINYLEQIVKLLGYEAAGEYSFPKIHLSARHYRHPQQEELDLPKLFISELIVDKLPANIEQLIYQTIAKVDFNSFIATKSQQNIKEIAKIFTRPWQPPQHSIVEQVNQVSQYGAWVLLHGYAVNHFTGYVNQNPPEYADIDTIAGGLANLGVPMKAEIEGDVRYGLRQTATQAVTQMVTVLDDKSGAEVQIPWTYAYYEIAQRYLVEVDGQQVLFDAFLGKNAQQLFELTRNRT